jgi:segregation and condensation protein B
VTPSSSGRCIANPGDAWLGCLVAFRLEYAGEFARAWLRRAPHGASADQQPVPTRRGAKLARVEAALIVAEGALTARKLAQSAALLDAGESRELVEQLNAAYDATGSAFRVERVGAGYQLFTRPVFARWLDRIHERQARLKLSPPALETLTVIAYRQPITRADIEAVRGVQSAELLKQLMERGLVKIVGEDDSLGRPYLYGTTRQFLEHYGLRHLDELPNAEQLRRQQSPPIALDTPDAASPDGRNAAPQHLKIA